MKQQIIPEGYKQTEVGVIPESWDVVTLDGAANFLDGQRRPVKSGDRAKMQGIYPYYGASGIVDYVNNYIFDGKYILLGEDGENILSRNLPLAFKAEGKIWVNNHAHIMQPKDGFNIDYLREYLESLDYSLLNSGTAQPKLNKQSCLNIKIIKPTEKEQTAIANALSDVDALITSIGKLIGKKQAIKTATMQQLLTGKKRLPPFDKHPDGTAKATKQTELGEIPEDWHVKSLKDITLDMLQGVNTAIDIPEYVESGIIMLKANNVIDQIVKFKGSDCISEKTYDAYNERFKIKKNDFLFSNIGARLGSGSLMECDKKCSFAWNVMRIVPNQRVVEPRFLAFSINSPLVSEKIKSEQSGSGMGFIPKSTMQKVRLIVPTCLKEQTNIATVLSNMDGELYALKKRLSKTQQIKQGMMQELLTGKTRLPFDKTKMQSKDS